MSDREMRRAAVLTQVKTGAWTLVEGAEWTSQVNMLPPEIRVKLLSGGPKEIRSGKAPTIE